MGGSSNPRVVSDDGHGNVTYEASERCFYSSDLVDELQAAIFGEEVAASLKDERVRLSERMTVEYGPPSYSWDVFSEEPKA